MFLNISFQKVAHLIKKELSYYFNNPFGYIAVILFAVFAHFMFVKDLFLIGDGGMGQFFEVVIWLLLIYVPVIGMRIYSEEIKSNTIEILYSLPITFSEIILSKFLTIFLFCSVGLMLTAIIPVMLLFIAQPHIPTIVVSYIGLLFLVSLFSSVSVFFSSLSESQIISFLSTILTLFFILVLGSDFLINVIPLPLQTLLVLFSPISHLGNFFKGIVDIRSIIFFITGTALFLYLTFYFSNKRQK